LVGPDIFFPDSRQSGPKLCFQGGVFLASLPEQTYNFATQNESRRSAGKAPGFALAFSADYEIHFKNNIGLCFTINALKEYANVPTQILLGNPIANTDPYKWDYLYPEGKIGFVYRL
jgi:hypothetical protein